MLDNFRDIGNIRVKNGTLIANHFYRSGELTDLSDDDKIFLKNTCSIKKVYDFRSKEEVTSRPDTSIEGIIIENIDILKSEVNSNSASINNMMNIKSKDVNQRMLETYTYLVNSESALKGYRKFLIQVLSSNEPMLFHCFAGKDRTGFAAAILLKIAGASDEQILSDYLQTNIDRASANRLIISSMESKLTDDQKKALNILLLVNKDYLIHARNVINKTYGSFINYLFDGLQVDKDYIRDFRKKYVIND